MPELPEIEIVKRSLVKSVKNAKIIGIKIKNRRLRYQIPNTFSKDLLNEKIIDISRRSKYLIFKLEKKILLVHLGMSGKFLLKTKRDKELFKTSFYYDLNIPEKHNHIYFILNNNLILIYNDVRRFGFLKIFKTKNLSKVIFLTKLGVEPLSKKFSKKYFSTFVKKRKKNIKNLLMDQTFISGLGNIYVNEALFMSKIHPLKKSNKLNKSEIENLVINIKKILKFSISKGGASIKNFKDTMDKSGKFQQFFYVYNKENKNCSRISCKGKIKRIIISSRSSFYCNKCQK
tara:strand:+ start:1053 stop:1916 length:864 start_codon:yes stop_codon:yes gene_type:complete